MIIKATSREHMDQVIAENKKVVLDFYADWCGPCKALGAVLEDLLEDIDFVLLKVDTDKFGEIAQEFGVSGIPHVVLFKDGQSVEKMIGFPGEEKTEEFVSL